MTACKKPLCAILAFILVFAFIAAAPVSVFAEDGEETTFSAQEIEVNKEVDGDFEFVRIDEGSSIEIVGYTGSDKEVDIPSKINSLSVISIGANAFEGNTTMEKVKLHTDIMTVGDGAFKNCTALKEFDNADAVESFGVSAFEGCVSMPEFVIPDNVTTIPEKCFAGCKALSEIKEHKNLKNVAADAFTGTAWENAKEDGALSFGRVLYSYKGNLSEIVIPKGVSIVEDYAFLGNENLTKVVFGVDVEEIGLYAFQNCVNLKTVEFDDAMGIVSAGAFKGCSSLTAADFSETTLAAIGYEAFSGCTSLTEVKLSETLSDIGDYAFADTKIATLEFFKNVNGINATAFDGVKTLTGISVVDKNKTFKAVDGVLYTKDGKAIVVYPSAKQGAFAIPAEVEAINDKAFKGAAVGAVTLAEGSSLNYIGVSAFEDSAVTAVTIPENVTNINSAAFKNAAKLAKITFTEGLT